MQSTPSHNDYVAVAEARAATGMRLAVTLGVPGPWGEAAKGIFHVKAISHLRTIQLAGEDNAELVAWTGMNSAPVAVYNDEPPRSGWIGILLLAERVQPDPPLIPQDERDRVHMFGLAQELCGEDGYGWNRRLVSFAALGDNPGPEAKAFSSDAFQRMKRKYFYGSVAHGRARMIAILRMLSEVLLERRAAGSRYYIGHQLTALDIYSACFMAFIEPLPLEQCPMLPDLRAGYAERDPDILAAVDPALLRHRDFIYQNHLELPMRL